MALHNISICAIYFTSGNDEDRKQTDLGPHAHQLYGVPDQTLSKALVALQRETRQAPGHISFDILRSTGQPVSFLWLEAFDDEEALATIAWMASCRVPQR
jgi:hypothetical protein